MTRTCGPAGFSAFRELPNLPVAVAQAAPPRNSEIAGGQHHAWTRLVVRGQHASRTTSLVSMRTRTQPPSKQPRCAPQSTPSRPLMPGRNDVLQRAATRCAGSLWKFPRRERTRATHRIHVVHRYAKNANPERRAG
jgi:hypothetical protein